MMQKYSNIDEFFREQKILEPGYSLTQLKIWFSPDDFVRDIKHMLRPVPARGGYQRDLPDRSFRNVATGSGLAPAPPVAVGLVITGDHVRKKLEANLISMAGTFRAKGAKGRAATAMLLYYSSRAKFWNYHFVLATSDHSSNDGKGEWLPTGNHEAIVWNWTSTDRQRLTRNVASIFGV